MTTERLGPNGNQIAGIELFDGRFRARQTQATAPDGKRTIADTTYNNRGSAEKVSSFYNNASGPSDTLVTFSDAAVDRQTVTTYDKLERATDVATRAGGVDLWHTLTGYDGDRVTATPPAGGTATTSLMDARGRQVEVWQHLGTTPTGSKDVTSYQYDRLGRTIKVTDPLGNHWDYTYDLGGRQTQAVDPDTGTTLKSYTDAGELEATTDARGEVVFNIYDALGRTKERRDDSATGTLMAPGFDPQGCQIIFPIRVAVMLCGSGAV